MCWKFDSWKWTWQLGDRDIIKRDLFSISNAERNHCLLGFNCLFEGSSFHCWYFSLSLEGKYSLPSLSIIKSHSWVAVLSQEWLGMPGTRFHLQLLVVLRRLPWQSAACVSGWNLQPSERRGQFTSTKRCIWSLSYRVFPSDEVQNATWYPFESS